MHVASIQGYKTKAEKQLEIGYATTSISMCQSKLGRFLADKLHLHTPMSLESITVTLQELVDKEITERKDPQSHKANELLRKFLDDSDYGGIQHLIRLYTLETKFYHALRCNPMPLALPFYIALDKLNERYFQGQTYRGAKMDDDEINTYQWAVNNKGSLLQTKHFSSTSVKRSIAEQFSTKSSKKTNNNRRNSVVFIYNFPDKCEQAINLSRISDKHLCLSEFEDEAEILVLPWVLFQVDKVEAESSSLSYTIHLTNVPLPHKGILSSLKWILKHPKGSIQRFKEHFPEKESEKPPESVVLQQLTETAPMSDGNPLDLTH